VRRALGVVAAALLLVAAACGNGDERPSIEGPTITVGSADFTGSIILGEIYAQALAAEGYDVVTRLRLGSREVYFPALESGEISLMPEYTGALVRHVTGDDATASTDELETYINLSDALAERPVTALDFSQAQDKDGVVVSAELAAEHDLATFSDLEEVAGELIMGAPEECPLPERFCGLLQAAGIEFSEVLPMDSTTAIDLLNAGEIHAANLFSADGRIAANDFVSLEDDLGIVPAENIVPVVHQDLIFAYGDELVDFVDALTARISTELLIELNMRVDVDLEDAEAVAADWLESVGILGAE
jgi:osmoprotectant transport system substrate-binding protein